MRPAGESGYIAEDLYQSLEGGCAVATVPKYSHVSGRRDSPGRYYPTQASPSSSQFIFTSKNSLPVSLADSIPQIYFSAAGLEPTKFRSM